MEYYTYLFIIIQMYESLLFEMSYHHIFVEQLF
jgi:hypothetical protein